MLLLDAQGTAKNGIT